MTPRDGLAPVTWLPGARPSPGADDAADAASVTRSPAVGRSASVVALPTAADEIPAADEFPGAEASARVVAESISIAALARRDLSSTEVRTRLLEREVDPDVADAEVERLRSIGLIDDERLVQTLIERLRRRKGLGRSGLRGELRRRGLDAEVIDAALDEIEHDDECRVALEAATRRARSLGGLERSVAERRLSGYLSRRGFSGSIIRDAVETALAEAGGRRTVRFE